MKENNNHIGRHGFGTDHALGNFTDGFTLVPYGKDECAKIMCTTPCDCTQYYPEKGGHPAPNHCQCGTYDGCSTCYGRKMVAKKDKLIGRHVIHAIFQGVGRYRGVNIDFINFFAR